MIMLPLLLIEESADQSNSNGIGADLNQRDKTMFYALLKKFPNDKNYPYHSRLLAMGNAVLVGDNQLEDNFFGL